MPSATGRRHPHFTRNSYYYSHSAVILQAQTLGFVASQHDVETLDGGTGGTLAQVIKTGSHHDTVGIAGDKDLYAVPAGTGI